MGGAKLLGYGLAITFMMVWVFALGVLTGRGDVNRLLQRLGLYKTDLAARLGVASDNQVSTALPVPAGAKPEEAHKAMAEAETKSSPDAKTLAPTMAVPAAAAKVADDNTAKPSTETAKKPGTAVKLEAKRSKAQLPQKPDKDPSLASRLSFQNSLDSPTRKHQKTVAKKEAAVHTAAMAPAPSQTQEATEAGGEKKKSVCAYQVKVASYRTAEEAEKALADLKKKGFKVSLQQGKDKNGSAYVIKTGRYTTKSEAEKITQKLKEAKVNGQIQELKQ